MLPSRRRSTPVIVILCVMVLMALLPGAAERAAADHSSVGVTPALLDFTDPPLLPGKDKVGVLRFQQHFDQTVDARIEVVPLGDPTGYATSWLRLSHEGPQRLAPGEHRITVRVEVPQTAADGRYEAGVRLTVRPPDGQDFDGSGATAEAAVTARVRIAVDNAHEVKRIAIVADPTAEPAEVGGVLRFVAPMENTGNVDANPRVEVDILDRMQERTMRTYRFNHTILGAGESVPVPFTVADHGLNEGQYWWTVTVRLDGAVVHTSKAQSLDVFEAGALARSLDLRRIAVEGNITRATEGIVLKITAHITNTGQAAVPAQFVGEVRRDGQLLGPLESRMVEVQVGEQGRLEMLYTPAEPGQYEFIGRVHYGHKVTEEKSLLLTVREDGGVDVPGIGTGVLVASLLALVAAFAARRR